MVEILGGAVDKAQAKQLNPLVLAFVGDSVQMLYIKTRLALTRGCKSGKLHFLTAESVNASAQAKTYEDIKGILNEEEMEVYKRARNAKTSSAAKNAKITEYRKATGFEAVLGYLYLSGQNDRLGQLLEASCRSE
jgi:ribonuclease-3 family protein